MKKNLLISLSSLFLATGCVDSLTEYNIDPKNPATVPATALFAGAERSMARVLTTSSVNQNPFRLWVQYWTETTYTDESNYDIKTRQIDRNFWDAMYAVLGNLNEAKRLVPNDKFASAKTLANRNACIEIMSVYAWSTLVNTYGNIPYTEALDFTKTQPKYDDARTIYTSLFTRLDAAIAALDASAEGMGDQDPIYNGDVTHWKQFGNSLKLRMAMTVYDDNPTQSAAKILQAAPNVFQSRDEQAQLNFVSSPPNTHPLFEDLVQSGRHDFVGTDFFIDSTLVHLNDPRVAAYFKPVAGTSDFLGGINGDQNDFTVLSEPGLRQRNPTLPGMLLSYSEVEFLLAEARARGIAVSGTAADHYEEGIAASIEEWGGSLADAAAYLAEPEVSFATAGTTATKQIERIALQKWIALYDQPVTAWTEWRRLDTPMLEPAVNALSDIPLRLTYPTPEGNLNGANYTQASTAIGGDKVTSKIFWDKR